MRTSPSSTDSSSFRVQRLRTVAELDGLQGTWLALERVLQRPSLFQSWTWNRLWCEEVLLQRKFATLDVRVIEDGAGRPLAILPLFTEWLAGPMVSLTQFLGHRMSHHNDMLLVEPNNPEDAPQRPGRLARKAKHNRFPQLQRHFHVELRTSSGSDFPSAFNTLITLHQQRFAEQHRMTDLAGANLQFLRRATAALSPPFVVTQLFADGVAIAAELWAYDRGWGFAVQKGFDPAFARFSPARILFAEILQRSFTELGCVLVDLGPGYEEYKYDGRPMVGMNYMCCYGGRGLYAKSVAALYQVAFRHHLPPVPPVWTEKQRYIDKRRNAMPSKV